MGCGKSKGTREQGLEFTPKDIADARPEALRRDINELFKSYQGFREEIKPMLAEKHGIIAMIDEEREKLVGLLSRKEELLAQRKPLMDRTWEKDADEIHKAFQKFTTDKSLLVKILCARTYWQIALINEAFERKYGVSLIEKVVNELTTMLGTLLTGGGTGLSKLLTYRILPQPERDAALIRDFTDGLSIEDANLLEILNTRTNRELKAAMDQFSVTYKRNLPDVIRSKCSYKNYREFVLQILECQREESTISFDQNTAKKYAMELHAAGGARTIGMDPEPFIRILANINNKLFEQINAEYPNHQLTKDITNKLGGDFQLAVLTRCMDKHEYLANRLDTAITKGFTTDNESICRILGCLSRPDCVKLKNAYNRLGFKKTLEEALRNVLKSQQNYLSACLTLISEDPTVTPLGSDKEMSEEEVEVGNEADRNVIALQNTYNPTVAIKNGEKLILKMLTESAQRRQQEADKRGGPIQMDDLTDEERVLTFYWDGKGRFLDTAKLAATFREIEYVENCARNMRDRLPDEIQAMQGVYASILKHRFETEAYIRIYGQHVRYLTDFVEKREPGALQQIKNATVAGGSGHNNNSSNGNINGRQKSIK